MRVAVPDGLAEALINAGLAKPAKAKYRSAIVEWIIEGADVGSTVVTLLGTPMVVKFYADWLKNYVQNRKESAKITIRDPDPKSGALVEISTDDNIADIEEKIKSHL